MEGESGITRIIVDELHSSDIQRYHVECESGVTASIVDEHHFSVIQRDHVE